jgi:hypothetical protein
MTEPTKLAFGYVVKRDGTIPWDEDPNRHPGHKTAVLEDLAARGHTVTQHPAGHFIVNDFEGGLKPHPDESAQAAGADA